MLTMNGPATLLVFVIQLRASTATECDYFLTFPSLTGQVYTAEERSNISFDFRVESTSTDCPIPESFTVTVERQDKGYRQTQCTIKHLDGKCGVPLSQQNTCSCLPEDRHFQLTKVLEQADNTTWWWRLEGNDKQVLFEREIAFHITSASNDSSSASWVEAPPDDEFSAAPPVGHGVDFTAIIIAGISAFTLIVIAFRIFRAKRGGHHDLPHNTDVGGQTTLTLESRIHMGSTHETNYYWEIRDPCSPSSDPPRSCLPPAPPENYLNPSVSAEVQEGTDDAKNVTPFYENSELRPLKLSDVTLSSSSSVMGAALTQINVETVSTPAGTDFVRVANENGASEETKVSAQRGASEDTEYGPETGYMPMSRKLDEGRAETDQESTEYTPMSRGVVSSPPDNRFSHRESGEGLEPEAEPLRGVSLSHRTRSEGGDWLSTAMENSC